MAYLPIGKGRLTVGGNVDEGPGEGSASELLVVLPFFLIPGGSFSGSAGCCGVETG